MPAEIAEITDFAEACAAPERSVLSVMAHGRAKDSRRAIEIAKVALLASAALDEDRRKLYGDLVYISLREDLRQELETMGILMVGGKPYEYQSDFAKKYVAQGELRGRADLILRQLTWRFGELSSDVQTRIRAASVDELEVIAKRLLTAQTLQQTLDPQ